MAVILLHCGTGGVLGKSLSLKEALKGKRRVAFKEASSQQLFFEGVPANTGPEPRQPDSRVPAGCSHGTGSVSLC